MCDAWKADAVRRLSYFVTELLGTDLHRLLTSRPLEKQFIQYFLYQILVCADRSWTRMHLMRTDGSSAASSMSIPPGWSIGTSSPAIFWSTKIAISRFVISASPASRTRK